MLLYCTFQQMADLLLGLFYNECWRLLVQTHSIIIHPSPHYETGHCISRFCITLLSLCTVQMT